MKIQKKLAVLFTVIAMIFLLIPTGVKAGATRDFARFNANADCQGSMGDQKIEYKVGDKLIANGFTREGYQFNGWNTKSDGSGKNIADQAVIADFWDDILGDLVFDVDDNRILTLYAQWKANTAPATAPAPKATAASSGWIPSFEIQFLDCNGKVISDQWVGDGQPAAIPDGYTYGEEELNWVYRNLTVSPVGCKVSGFVVPDTADKN